MSTHPKVLERSSVTSLRPAAGPAAGRELDDHLVSLLSPASYEAEQYHVLRHDLEQLHRSRGFRVFAVTSPEQDDGKTTTAINLAAALAQDPRARVLLIDADLRHPSVAERLGLVASGAPGLVEAILEPDGDLDALVQRHELSNLAILAADRCPARPYDILQSPRVGELLDRARAGYDYVLLDTPPLLPVPDCRIVARWVDGFLMVVAAHRTPRKQVEEALNVIDPAKLMGLVFNGDDRPYSSYRAYYEGAGKVSAGSRPGWLRSLWGRARGQQPPARREGWW